MYVHKYVVQMRKPDKQKRCDWKGDNSKQKNKALEFVNKKAE